MAERKERDLREYGMDYTQRLSARVSDRHIKLLDAAAELENVNRGQFIRKLIDRLEPILEARGVKV